MPLTFTALIIIIFAYIPGTFAYYIYSMYIGVKRNETQFDKVTKVIGFSLGGIILYIIFAEFTNLPLPIYLFPSTYNISSFTVSILLPISWALIGHFVGSAIISISLITIINKSRKWMPKTPYPTAWDDFIRLDVPKHWVVIHLNNGEAYAGIIKNVDISVNKEERDIVLSEPARYCSKTKNYIALQYQSIFLSADMIASVAVVHDPEIDKRISQIGAFLFTEEGNNVRK